MEPFKSLSLVGYSPRILVVMSHTGLQSQVFWRPISQVPVLKVGVPDVRYERFTPHGDAPFFLFFEFLPDCGLFHCGVGFMLGFVCLPASMWFLACLRDVK